MKCDKLTPSKTDYLGYDDEIILNGFICILIARYSIHTIIATVHVKMLK